MKRSKKSPAVTSRRGSLHLYAVVGVALLAFATVYAFGKQSLFAGGTEVNAVFADASQLRGGSPVRVAGLDIGRVSDVAATSDGSALVTMRLKGDAPTLRTSDRMTVKPRLPFEGNFYIDVTPGNPRAPELAKGDTIPRAQTGATVQLDQVLSTLRSGVRRRALGAVGNLASGLGTGGSKTPVGDATGVRGLRQAVRELRGALPTTARTARALRGRRPGDLSRTMRSTAALTATLARDPGALSDVITNYATVIDRFADSEGDLRASLRSVDGLLSSAPRSLRRIDSALPITRQVALDLRPGLAEIPKRLPAVDDALDQVRHLARPAALPAFSRRLLSTARIAPQVVDQLRTALPMVTSLGKCVSRTIVPTAVQQIPDGVHTVDQPAWLELLHAFSGLAAASPTADANGSTIRAGLGEGDTSLAGALPGVTGGINVINGGSVQGVSPEWLGNGQRPKKRVDLPCADQDPADFSQLTGSQAFQGFTRTKNRADSRLPAGDVDALQELRSALGDRMTGGGRSKTTPKTDRAPSPTASSAAPTATAPPAAGASPDPGGSDAASRPAPAQGDLLSGVARLVGGLLDPTGERSK